MTTYYVGTGGSDASNGLTWANRKLTLTGAEDVPVVAGDTVYVGPGAYRELLTVDVSGSGGSPITYIADVTGENTDGVGGAVRITASDNDTSATRGGCITAASKNYRTFRGFTFDLSTTTTALIVLNQGTNWIIEDCTFQAAQRGILAQDATTDLTVRRCVFMTSVYGAWLTSASDRTTCNNAFENCLFMGNGGAGHGLNIDRYSGMTVRHCLFHAYNTYGLRVGTAAASGVVTVNNCMFYNCNGAVQGPSTAAITEDYNAFFGNQVDRSNTSTGSNSNAYPPLFALPMLFSGIPALATNALGTLSQWSAVRRLTGSTMSSLDLYGLTRPATDSKKSWGAVQYNDKAQETTTVRTGAASIKLADAGAHQMFVPTSNSSTTFSVYVQWEADYAGTLPSLTVRQPGQSDSTDTATGSSGTWEQLSVTLTPAASPGYCVVELRSSNTATSGSYDTFFDDLTVA